MTNIEKAIKLITCGRKYSPMSASGLAELLKVDDSEYHEFCDLLYELELKGDIVRVKKKQYANPRKVNLMVGTLEGNQRGFGFVIPAKEGISTDVYVSGEDMGGAMHGDIVVVRLPSPTKRSKKKTRRIKKTSGQIVNVLRRENETVVGTFKRSKHLSYVVPDNPALFKDIYVTEDPKDVEHGDKVIVKIDQWPNRHHNAEGAVIDVLGKDGDPIVDVQSIIHQFKLPFEFKKDVLDEVKSIPQSIGPEGLDARLDLRKELIITIDPDDAKDFDDAISLTKDEDGNWLLGVYIADVPYYMKHDSALDKEARKRGTSVYFPGTVIPMLPETLSNGICSLKEGEDRLTKNVFFTYSPDGKLLNYEIGHSVINVKKRLTYNIATNILAEDGPEDEDHITSMLREMKKLAHLLYKIRIENGALELDLPEISIKLDEEGKVSTIEKVKSDVSHKIIEEFMIAANNVVARFMHEKTIPIINRVHPEPDEGEMHDFAEFILNCKSKAINPFDKKKLQAFLKEIQDQPESYMINMMLLRSLRKAEYSATESVHYALGLEHYAHFTSPIRRYPDLIVHRLLDMFLAGQLKSKKLKAQWDERVAGWAAHCSMTEKRSAEAEREIVKLKLLRHLEEHGDEVMEGIITGVQEYGLFVQINELLLDGLVHIRTLTDDYYELDKKKISLIGTRKGKTYSFGDLVKIKITNIDLLKREVDFVIVKE